MDQFTMAETQTTSRGTAAKYAIETRLSRFTVQAFAGGILAAVGHSPVIAIRDFSGEIRLEPDALEHSSMHLKIRADSLSVISDSSDKDRREIERQMNTEVLETDHYPEIIFDAQQVSATRAGDGYYSVSLSGDLHLHGVMRSLTIPAQLNVTGEMLRASGNFTIRQTEYGIKLVSVAGGVLKVKDELKFNFDIVARRQD